MNRKAKVIILGFGRATELFIKTNLESEIIDIIGLVPESSKPGSKSNELSDKMCCNVPVREFSHKTFELTDIVFSLEYGRIIPKEYCEKYNIVNCHGGILPKWRGFAANAWAIMNNEEEIGYSVHKVTDELDGGDLYYVKHIPINKNQTYADVHVEMLNSIAKEVPPILFDISNNDIQGIKQTVNGIAYCCRFNKEMGNISGFMEPTEYYINLYRCMAPPLGTGVFFEYLGARYNVGKIENGKDYGVIDYVGIMGKIVNIYDDKMWVKTGNNVVILSDIMKDGQKINVNSVFRNGMLLK